MIRVTRAPSILLSENFNATTSLINCGADPTQYPLAQSMCAVVFPIGSGETSTNTVFGTTPSAATTGTRFFFGHDATPGWNVRFNAHSSGTSSAPARDSALGAELLSYSVWHFAACTWDGGLAATGAAHSMTNNATRPTNVHTR